MVIGAYISAESKDNYPAIKVPSYSLPMSVPVFLYAFSHPFTEDWRYSVDCLYLPVAIYCGLGLSLFDLCSLMLLQISFRMVKKFFSANSCFLNPS